MKQLILFISLIFISYNNLCAQSKQVQIEKVENNLIPFVSIKGSEGMNIYDRMKYYNVLGVSIAVINNYKIAWAKGYGYADTARRYLVNSETMFSAGSISKFVAAVTALKMVEEGKLNLDSPINNYLTTWKIKENDFTKRNPINLKMLLSHTGGISQSSFFGFTPDRKILPSILDILNGAPGSDNNRIVVNSEPKKEFRYSGGGLMIAQMAMMDVSKRDFETINQEKLFNVLGMKNSTFQQPLPAKFKNQTSWGYSAAPWYKGMPYIYPQQAAAGLYSTPTDIAKVFIDVQKSIIGKGKILNKSTAEKMFTSQSNVSEGGYKEQIGIGPFLLQRADNTDKDGVYFEFTGVNAGFVAYAIGSVENGNGAVIMLNTGDDFNGLGKEIRRSIAKSYNWKNFLPEEVVPVILTDDQLTNLIGRFRRSEDEVIYIRKEGNYLVEKINQSNDIICVPISKDSIVFTDFNIKGKFNLDENGNAMSLQSEYQKTPMLKMKDHEFTPTEYLLAGKYEEAKNGFRKMNMNEYQLTYFAYDLLNKKPVQLEASKAILELAEEKFPNSSIVYNRWGNYYFLIKNNELAKSNFEKALKLDPQNTEAIEMLSKF